MNISSLIVDVRPESVNAVRAELGAWPGVLVHAATAEGKLVVTVETDTDSETTDIFGRIAAAVGVMSVAMVYHQFETEPEEEACDGTDPT